mmetsp:Transcript_10315/g.20624  ORF Transcript_10315/g.20624 Transcript_10315/m.20624 type:complete len:415 (+) Transcript_10315:1-1245(+)
MLRSLYGLAQSPKNWFDTLTAFLIKLGCWLIGFSGCVYGYKRGSSLMLLCIYVDDAAIASNDESLLQEFVTELRKHFDVSESEDIKWYLSVHYQRDVKKGVTTANQSKFARSFLSLFDMLDATPVVTPMEPHTHFEPAAEDDLAPSWAGVVYRCGLGKAQYLCQWTRPDLAYTVGCLALYASKPGWTHIAGLRRLLQYLAGTAAFGIRWVREGVLKNVIYGDVDASWADCPTTRRGTSGYVFFMKGGPIDWKSKKQDCIGLSSVETEYIAFCKAVVTIMDLRYMIRDLFEQNESWADDSINDPTILFEDSTGVLAMTRNRVRSERSKHIDMRVLFCRERVLDGTIKLVYCPTARMLADFLTKALSGPAFIAGRNETMQPGEVRLMEDARVIAQALTEHCQEVEDGVFDVCKLED